MTLFWSLLRVLASAALLYGGQGLQPLAWMMWLAPLPLMLYRDQHMGWRRAGLEALAAGALGGLTWWTYLSSMAPAPIAALAIVQPALVLALGMLLMWLARRQGRFALATVMPALTTTSCELLVTMLSPHGSFGSIAYTQADCLALMQMLSVTGLPGVTALLCWVPAAASAFWWQRTRALRLAAPAFLVLGLVWIAGQQRMGQAPEGTPLRIAVMADDAQLSSFNRVERVDAVFAHYADRVRQLALHGAKVVLLPEKTISVGRERAHWLRAQLQAVADNNGVVLAVGVNLVDAPKQNLAWLLQPGAPMQSYQKRHLVPGWESGYAAGAAPLTTGAYALAICKDLDFPGAMRAYAGQSLLLVPAWDFGADAWLHSRMALARGIELGIPMVRGAHEGRLTLSTAMGVITHELPSHPGEPVGLIGELVPGAVPTLYARLGDVFGYVVLAAWMLACLRLAGARAGLNMRSVVKLADDK